MKQLLVCMCSFLAVSNAGFLGSNGGGNHIRGGDYSNDAPATVIKVKVINEDYGGGNGHGRDTSSAPEIYRVIHQQSSRQSGSYGGNDASAAPQVIRVIHQNSAASDASRSASSTAGGYSYGRNSGSAHGPVTSPAKVIKVIHENSASNSVPPQQTGTPTNVIRIIHEHGQAQPSVQSGSSATSGYAPAKVIRVIHEQAQGQSAVQTGSFASSPVNAPENNYLPPVQTPAPVSNSPLPQYSAPASQQTAPVSQYPPPLPQYGAPASSFTAAEPAPAPARVPAQTYGPSH